MGRFIYLSKNIETAHERKQNNYASLIFDMNHKKVLGIKMSLVCFEVGSRGLVSKDMFPVLDHV